MLLELNNAEHKKIERLTEKAFVLDYPSNVPSPGNL